MPPMNDKQKAAYVAGFFDGEGHIAAHKTARGQWTRQICVVNTDKALIDSVAAFLHDLGIPTRKYVSGTRKGWSDKWVLYVAKGREAYCRFREIIPIKSKSKRQALSHLCDQTYDDKQEYSRLRRTGDTSLCETCKRSLYVSPAFRARGQGRYCSRACRDIARRRPRAQHSCKFCGAAFERAASVKNPKFCSRECAGKTKSDQMRAQAKLAAEARWHH